MEMTREEMDKLSREEVNEMVDEAIQRGHLMFLLGLSGKMSEEEIEARVDELRNRG